MLNSTALVARTIERNARESIRRVAIAIKVSMSGNDPYTDWMKSTCPGPGPPTPDHAGQVGCGGTDGRDGGPARRTAGLGGGQDLDDGGTSPVVLGRVRRDGRVDPFHLPQPSGQRRPATVLHQDIHRFEDPGGDPTGFQPVEGGVGGPRLGQGRRLR